MIDFWLIRHGETIENATGTCQGQTDGTLSEKGQQQAVALGEVLQQKHFDHYYSSDLKRTMDTMKEVVRHHPNQEIIPESLLRERYLADWQGKPFPKNWKGLELPVGAETAEDLIRRASEFLQLLKNKHKGQKIAVMSHGGLIRAFWTVINGLDTAGYYTWTGPENTSISRFLLSPDGSIETVFRNQSEHLNQAK